MLFGRRGIVSRDAQLAARSASQRPHVVQRLGIFRHEIQHYTINTPLDPAAKALLTRFPTPTNLTAAANNYTRTANDADHQSQFDVRIDGAFRSSDRAFGRYTFYKEVEQPVTPLPDGSGLLSGSVLGTGGVAGLSNVLGQQAVFNETHTFSARLLNDLRLGYTRRGNTIAGTDLSNTASAVLGIPGIPTNAAFNNALSQPAPTLVL